MKLMRTICSAALAAGLASGASAEVYRLQTSQNAGDFTLQYLQEVWVPRLTEISGGEIELELLPINSVVPAAEGLDAVSMGILDGLHDAVSRSTGKDPAFGMFADMVAGYNNPDQGQAMCMNAGGKEFMQKLVDEYSDNMVHVVGCAPYTRESLPSAVPIRGVEDLEGLKIRAPEGLPAELFSRAGATSVPIPFSEVYTSLEKGVIDAADASSYINNHATGLHKVAPYPIQPGIHSQAILYLAFNKDVWEAFTPAQQQMINTWYMAALPDLRRYSELEDNKVITKDRAGGADVKEIIDWSAENRAKFREIAKTVWQDYAKLSPLAQEAYDVQVQYLRDAGLLE
ncbi:TRAP transporter substrate-binding protein DctP [Rhodobacteraceae bacterium R_SAG2]|nr:TRAP transporter substrate-binding protein DctP [Rhodobacteraceae bacterium R_SAG2]